MVEKLYLRADKAGVAPMTPVLSAREILEQALTMLGTVTPTPGRCKFVRGWVQNQWAGLYPTYTGNAQVACSVGAMMLAKRLTTEEITGGTAKLGHLVNDPEFAQALLILGRTICDVDHARYPTYLNMSVEDIDGAGWPLVINFITTWNDSEERTWPDVEHVFTQAIKRAIEEESK